MFASNVCRVAAGSVALGLGSCSLAIENESARKRNVLEGQVSLREPDRRQSLTVPCATRGCNLHVDASVDVPGAVNIVVTTGEDEPITTRRLDARVNRHEIVVQPRPGPETVDLTFVLEGAPQASLEYTVDLSDGCDRDPGESDPDFLEIPVEIDLLENGSVRLHDTYTFHGPADMDEFWFHTRDEWDWDPFTDGNFSLFFVVGDRRPREVRIEQICDTTGRRGVALGATCTYVPWGAAAEEQLLCLIEQLPLEPDCWGLDDTGVFRVKVFTDRAPYFADRSQLFLCDSYTIGAAISH